MIRRILRNTEPQIRTLYHRVMEGPPPNLNGDRAIEYSWIAANMPEGPGCALDFGTGAWSWMALLAARKGFQIVGLDLQPAQWPYLHTALDFIQGDILKIDLPSHHFDLVINCSAVEHVGLPSRYSTRDSLEDGDLAAMKRLRGALKSGKTMLLTVPVGRDSVFVPLHRVYGTRRLPSLVEGWQVEKEEYWIKDHSNRWTTVDKTTALARQPSRRCYGLGLFVLRA